MSNLVDEIDLVDDCAPMPGEIKPLLKSNPIRRTLTPLTKSTKLIKNKKRRFRRNNKTKKAFNKQIISEIVSQQRNHTPAGIAINIGKNNLGGTVFAIPKRKGNIKMDQQPQKSNRMKASSFMQQPFQRSYLSNYPKGIPRSFLEAQQRQNIGVQSTSSSADNAQPIFYPSTPAGIPRSFLTPEHQQQIGQTVQSLGKDTTKGFQQQTIPNTPNQPKTGMSKPKFGTNQQNIQPPNKTTPGFKQSFQPVEPEKQPQASNININLLKPGTEGSATNTTNNQGSQNSADASKPEEQKLTRKQRKEIGTKNYVDQKKITEENAALVGMSTARKAQQAEKLATEQKQTIVVVRGSPQPQPTTPTSQQSSHPLQTPVRPQQTMVQQQATTEQQSEGKEPRQVYSPSDIYNETPNVASEEEENNDDMDGNSPGSKRLSAFRRLGPVTQPKKPKMTINWLCNKEVREVVETVEDEEVPVHLRKYIQLSTDDIVLRYLPRWPWINPPPVRRTVSARHSKSVMILEQEQMDDMYKKDNTFFQLSITGYPDTWTKEDVLDIVLESLKGNSFIPCFIEFSKSECKFLVIRCRTALLALHKLGFVLKQDDVTLHVTLSVINFNVNILEFVPRLILMKRLTTALTDTELNLKRFTLEKDVSHFIYFPLHRQANQIELLKLQSTVQWDLLTKLDLSHNKLTNLNGFFFKISTPKLKHLILSHNLLDKISCLFNCRDLPLKSIVLEGNPLCNDYIEKEHYVKVLKMLFTELVEIDGVNIIEATGIPSIKQNYCTEEAQPIISRVLEVFFPLLEAPLGERLSIQEMYDDNAMLTITHMPRLRYSPIYLDFRSLFKYARILEEDEHLCINGASSIAKVLCKWPQMEHDPYTFTVDLMYHMDTTIIFRIGGIFKLTSDSLADDEPLLYFTRTFVLNSRDGVEYKINNEMVYWELPSRDSVKAAFKSTSVWNRQPSLKLESPPDEELKENLLQIFMNLTHMERNPSLKCLELKNWHLRNALDYFVNLLKLDNLDPIMK